MSRIRSDGPLANDIELLIDRAARGEDQAFADLRTQFSAFVQSVIGRRLGTTSADAADDLAQEVWHNVHQRLDTYDANRASFVRWLTVIATRKVINFSERSRVRRSMMERLRTMSSDQPSHHSDAAQVAVTAEMVEAVRVCAQRLEGRARDVFRMVRLAEVPASRIAELLGISPGRVRGVLSEANKLVLECLRSKGMI